MGWINAALYLMNRATSTFTDKFHFNKYYFVMQLLSDQPTLPKGKGLQISVVELSADTYPHPCPRPQAVIDERYGQGATCLAAYKGEEFAGCLWYCKNQFKEDEVRCLYQFTPSQAVWDFDVYVEPKYRLSPVFLKLWDTASAKLTQEGYDRSLSRISAFNPMSLSSHKRMGAKILGWAVFIRILAAQITLASVSPYLHISFSGTSFPVFKL